MVVVAGRSVGSREEGGMVTCGFVTVEVGGGRCSQRRGRSGDIGICDNAVMVGVGW